jgi:hypothetical protein
MQAASKNKKRIQSNTRFIEDFSRSIILNCERAVAINLLHEDPISLSDSKKKIRSFLYALRVKSEKSRYLLLTTPDNQIPSHKMLISDPTQKILRVLEKRWQSHQIEEIDQSYIERAVQGITEFYVSAVENLADSLENSRFIKSKLFQHSRIAN